jgi:hypothetical protein
MAGDGLGLSGSGSGMFNRLFDVGLELGTAVGRQQLGIQPGANQATRLGLTQPQLNSAPPGSLTVSNKVGGGFQLDQQTILIGVAVIVVALLLSKS